MLLIPSMQKAHDNGDIHIHDMDFYTLTMTCCQIDLVELLKDGFSTGHGHLREPNSIESYAALACIAIQSNQNDQHGGQSVPNFDYGMAPGVRKSFIKLYYRNMGKLLEGLCGIDEGGLVAREICKDIEEKYGVVPQMGWNNNYLRLEAEALEEYASVEDIAKMQDMAKFHRP